METLAIRRARLRLELQDAYDAWSLVTEARANSTLPSSVIERSGSPKETEAEWFEYLAAKERLVLAYAEQSAAGF